MKIVKKRLGETSHHSKGVNIMKCIYNNEIQVPKFDINLATTYNYESRKKASNENMKFVHLFESKIDENKEIKYTYYSTMKM